MFKKLRTILFEEELELDEESTLTENTQEMKTVVAVEETASLIVETPVEEVIKTAEPIKEVVEVVNESSVKRIDVDQPVVKTPRVKPTPAQQLQKPSIKPEPVVQYKPKAVISPMFGLTEAEMQKTIQVEEMTTKIRQKPRESVVISPIFGEIRPEEAPTISKKAKTVRKDQKVNLTLEEMLNIDNQQEMEFSLFDLPLDAKEFQSREHTRVYEGDEPDGLSIMKGDNE